MTQGAAAAAAEAGHLERLCELVLAGVGDRGEAQVTATATHSGLTRFANSGIHQHVGEDITSVTLKVAVDGRAASVDTTRIDDAGIYELVESAVGAARIRPVDPDWPGLTPPTDVPDLSHHDPDTHGIEPAARAKQVAAFVAAGEELRAAGYVDTSGTRTVLANSAGHHVVGESTRATVDGIHQTPTSAGSAHQTSSRFADVDGATAGERAARLARAGADPTDVQPGHYEVVLAPECIATIVTFLAYYGFNAKEHLEGQSFVELGETQFDAGFDLWDDATDDRAIGVPFDAEGTPKQRLHLVTNGVTAGLAHDRRTAGRAGARSTGHAIPGGEMWGAVPTDLFVRPGTADSLDALVADVDRGILVTTFNYCRILDPKSQVVTGLTRNGTFLIEAGEVSRPLTNLRFTQSFVDALKPGHLLGATSEARFADGEFGPGMVHTPGMHLAEWNFTGGVRG